MFKISVEKCFKDIKDDNNLILELDEKITKEALKNYEKEVSSHLSNNAKKFYSKKSTQLTKASYLIKSDKDNLILTYIIKKLTVKLIKDAPNLFSDDKVIRKEAVKNFVLNTSLPMIKINNNISTLFGIFNVAIAKEEVKKITSGNKSNQEEKEDDLKKEKKETSQVNQKNKSLKKIDSKHETINDLNEKINNLNLQIQNQKDNFSLKIKNQDEEINSLKNQLKEEKDKNLKLQQQSKSLKANIPDSFDETDLKNSLDNGSFIGRYKENSFHISQNKFSFEVTLEKNIVNKISYTNVEKFLRKYQLIGPDLSFLISLEFNTAYNIFEVPNFSSLSKHELIESFETLLKKYEFFFKPNFVSSKKSKTRNECVLISLHKCSEKQFENPVLIPIYSGSYEQLTHDIADEHPIKIEGTSCLFNREIKYLICENKLIEIDLIHFEGTSDINLYKSKTKVYSTIKENFTGDLHGIFTFKDDKAYYINQDNLNKLIYGKVKEESKQNTIIEKTLNTIELENALIKNVSKIALKNDLYYYDQDIVNFHTALKTSQLVILAGSSGTGKTQLPFLYTQALNMSEEKGDVLFIPISPAFIEPNDVLGYFKPNLYKSEDNDYDGSFMEASTNLASFLVKASQNRDKLFIVIFDEMNLSQIEYWFSPFMSIMERRGDDRKLVFYSSSLKCKNKDIIPPSIEIHENVKFIGTINLDETTKDISDRLIDRSIIIKLKNKSFNESLSCVKDGEKDSLPLTNLTSKDFSLFTKNKENFISSLTEKEILFFDKLNNFIRSFNPTKQISFRTLKTISNYLNNSSSISQYLPRETAIDLILKQTVIAKLNGSDSSITNLLDTQTGILAFLEGSSEISNFNESKEELKRKAKELLTYGFTR